MKKLIYIILLIILGLQMGGMLTIFNIHQSVIRFEMKEKLENDSTLFENLTLTTNEYSKSRINSREIFFKGKMYDIKSMSITVDSVKLIVINDAEEEKIIQLIKQLANSMNSSSRVPSSRLQFLTLLKYITPKFEIAFSIPFFQIELFLHSEPGIKSDKPDILTPPPRFV